MKTREYPDTINVHDPYVDCSPCAGSGFQESLGGPTECYFCNGSGVERDRDAKGRFITRSYTMYHIGDGAYDRKPPTQAIQDTGGADGK